MSKVRELRDSQEFSAASFGLDQPGAITMTSVGTQIVVSVMATTMNTHAAVAAVLSLEEPTTCSADR
jgi:uncharacterized membrane-anchored protein